MIYDCFSYNGEEKILETRLKTLASVENLVHIIVESNRTQSLREKPYYFDAEKFKEYSPRIKYLKIDAANWSNDGDLWRSEHAQRNYCLNGLIDANENDYVLISDCDEIPCPEKLKEVVAANWNEIVAFDMIFLAYFINLAARRPWTGSVLTTVKKVREMMPQGIRNIKDHVFKISGGYHLSWIMSPENLLKKSYSCIEPFSKDNLPDLETFEKYFEEFRRKDQKHFIHIEDLSRIGELFDQIPLDQLENLEYNKEDFKEFIL